MFGSTGSNVEFDYDPEIPEDEVAEAAERESKSKGAAWLVRAGFAPEDVLAAMGLPPMRFVGGGAKDGEEIDPGAGGTPAGAAA